MKRARQWRILCAGLACLPGLVLAQAEGLKHDPFARPALAPRPAAAAGDADKAAPAPWNPQLRAVMVTGANSLVDIDGTVVPLQGQIDGHRLVEVNEESAVLLKGGKRMKLWLYGETSKVEGGK